MTTCDIYVRLSEDKYGDELGIDRQESECRAFAKSKGWKVRHVHADNDLSATTGVTRPAFEALLQSSPERIVCWHSDRCVRRNEDLERVIKLNVNVYAVHTGHLDLSTPAGRAVARTVTAWAQYEGEQKALRQKSSAKQRAEMGKQWWPSRPFGFEMDATHRKAEADALRKTYRNLLAGATLVSLARELTKQGLTTNKGNAWRAGSLRPVLLNARNAGIRVYEGVEYPATWKPIVPEETYRAAVRLLNSPQRRTNGGGGGRGRRENLLTGLAECGVCGGPIRVMWRGVKGAEGAYKIYQCAEKHCVSIRAELADTVVEEVLFARLAQKDASQLLLPQSENVEALLSEQAELRRRLGGILDDYADGQISREDRNRMSERVRARLAEVDRAVQAIGLADVLVDLLDVPDIHGHWGRELDVNAQHVILSAYVERVKLMPVGKGRKAGLEHVKVWRYGDTEPLKIMQQSVLRAAKAAPSRTG